MDKNIYITMFAGILLSLTVVIYKYLGIEKCIDPQFSYSPAIPFAGDKIKFTAELKNAKVWFWNFGDSSSESKEKNPVYAYNRPGKYIVSLKISDNCFVNNEIEVKSKIVAKRVTPSIAPPLEIFANEQSFFKDHTPGATKATWYMEDKLIPVEGKETGYTFTKPGKKKVTVSVKGEEVFGDTTFYVDVKPAIKAAPVPVAAAPVVRESKPAVAATSAYAENDRLKKMFNDFRLNGNTSKGNQLKEQIKALLCDGESTPLYGDPNSDIKNKYESFYDFILDIENIGIVTSVKTKRRGDCVSAIILTAIKK